MSSTDSAESGTRRPRTWLRPLSLLVLLVVAAIAVGSFFVTRQVVHDQEHKLLKQRTDEAGIALGAIGPQLQSALSFIVTSAGLHPGDHASFASIARPLTTPLPPAKKPAYQTVALIQPSPTPTIVDQAGRPITDVGAERSAVITQALKALANPKTAPSALVTTPLFGSAAVRHFGIAYASPLLPNLVVYAETDVRPGDPTPVTDGAPFSELAVAVYVGPKPLPDQLVISTAGGYKLPLRGNTASVKAHVGLGQPWLMVTKARHPLVGTVAGAMPWALLTAGLVAALLATIVVETLGRRREYAADVAEQRTRELKESLEELEAAQHQLVRQERLAAIGELASTIGHELRNPLGVISNALFLLRRDIAAAPADGAAARHLATAEREVSAATVIVSDLLEFARQRDPVMIQVDITALVDEVLGVLPPPTGITVRSEVPASTVGMADRDMLRQVLLNLLGNAYQAMPEGGSVTIGARSDDGGVHVSVTDTGPGMSAEVQRSLFQPFFTTKARGVGLGLAVCKRIIDAHGGTIDVDSSEGAGATFTVNLPQVRGADVQVPTQTATGADELAGARPTGAQQ